MELGEKLRQARLEAGLSQRQLCGEVITRNMLSQIEHGTARPSMTTLRYLASRLEKPISFFLEETALQSPNPGVMAQARGAFRNADAQALREALAEYRSPDPIFDEEWKLLSIYLRVWDAKRAMADDKHLLAADLLAQAEEIGETAAYYTQALARQVHLIQGRLKSAKLPEICEKLPPLDGELLLRAEVALTEGEHERCLWLLGAAEEQSSPKWNYLRGELYLAQEDYSRAAECYHRAESAYGAEVFAKLERCYRELEDYKRAYEYACRQK